MKEKYDDIMSLLVKSNFEKEEFLSQLDKDEQNIVTKIESDNFFACFEVTYDQKNAILSNIPVDKFIKKAFSDKLNNEWRTNDLKVYIPAPVSFKSDENPSLNVEQVYIAIDPINKFWYQFDKLNNEVDINIDISELKTPKLDTFEQIFELKTLDNIYISNNFKDNEPTIIDKEKTDLFAKKLNAGFEAVKEVKAFFAENNIDIKIDKGPFATYLQLQDTVTPEIKVLSSIFTSSKDSLYDMFINADKAIQEIENVENTAKVITEFSQKFSESFKDKNAVLGTSVEIYQNDSVKITAKEYLKLYDEKTGKQKPKEITKTR